MTNKAFQWLLGALLLNTLQIGFGLYEIYIRQHEPIYSVVASFIPGVALNIIMFVYLMRKKKNLVIKEAKDDR